MANQLLQEDSFAILLEDGSGVLLIDGGLEAGSVFESDVPVTQDVSALAFISQSFEAQAPVTQGVSARVRLI